MFKHEYHNGWAMWVRRLPCVMSLQTCCAKVVLADPVLADLVLADVVLADVVLANVVLADLRLADAVLTDHVLADFFIVFSRGVFLADWRSRTVRTT